MSKRLWLVLVGGQAGAVVGPVLSRYQAGDCLHFIYSKQTADQQHRLEACFKARFDAPPTAKHLAQGREPLDAPALLRQALATFASEASQKWRVVVVGNGGPKQWFFELLEALRSLELEYELLLSQGSMLTAATPEDDGSWSFESSTIQSLRLHELCSLLDLTWAHHRLSARDRTLELARLECHYNRLHAHVRISQKKSSTIASWCRSHLLPPHLYKFSLEPRHVVLTGIDDTSGILPRLRASRFLVCSDDGAVDDLLRSGHTATEAPESSHVGPIPFASASGVQRGPVGVLIVGTLAGNTFATIDQLNFAGCKSILIVADGASERTVNNVRQVTQQLARSPRYQQLSWDVLWAKRGARSGMAQWREAPAVPEIEPGPLAQELRRRLAPLSGGGTRVSVIANMQPGDRAFCWALWEALNALRDQCSVSWTLASRPSKSPLLLRLQLQAGVERIESSPIVGQNNLTRAPITTRDQEEFNRLLKLFGSGNRFSERHRARHGPNGNTSDWFRLEKVPDNHGPLFERFVAFRLAQVLDENAAAFLNVQCYGSKAPAAATSRTEQLNAEDEMDLVTLVEPSAFIVWEAKGRPFKTLKDDKSELKLAVSRTFKYSPLLPEKTHTVAVVPKNDSPLEWRYKHDVCIIDLRILLDDAKLKALATRGPAEVAPPHNTGGPHR